MIYYGTEQMFNGGGDPNNRESLWPHYYSQASMYKVNFIHKGKIIAYSS
jgi:alpha-amylase